MKNSIAFAEMLDIQFDFDMRTTVDNPKYTTLKHTVALLNEVAEVMEVIRYNDYCKDTAREELVDCYAFWLGLFLKYARQGQVFPNRIIGTKEEFIPLLAGVCDMNIIANKMVWCLGGDFKYWSKKEADMSLFAEYLMKFYERMVLVAGQLFNNEQELLEAYKSKMGVNHDRQDSGKY